MSITGLEKPHILTQGLWLPEQIREGERQAAAAMGMAMFELMSRAGLAAFELARREWPGSRHWWVFCGGGNNGGDGYVVARLARAAGIKVQLVQMGDADALTGDAAIARDHYRADGGAIERLGALQGAPDLVIDAVLGTGLNGAPREVAQQHIDVINRQHVPVLAIDVPSGLCAGTGCIPVKSVSAAATITFVGLKSGLLTGRGPDVCGRLWLADLGIQHRLEQQPAVQLLHWHHQRNLLPVRRCGAHKGETGRLLVAGGYQGMSGAIRLAGEAALRCGTGLVRLLSHAGHVHWLNLTRPELMTAVFPGFEQWAWSDALIVGPGLGRHDWSRQLLTAALAAGKPMVIDADALHLLKERVSASTVITPHSGEAAAMLGCTAAEIESNRLLAVQRLREQTGAVVVLKGAGTLIAGEQGLALCPYGNPGMASGGMGDLLSGIIGAFLAQGLAPEQAARLGVCLHAKAGDMAAQSGMVGMLASDLLNPIRSLINRTDEYDNNKPDSDTGR
ncbi:NAD(P)H-hydrate dehydratase [Oceanimonas baumannii]|uniref:Bifunctional NAD(P)H-hydrate repair enzyme n=1 Tax=Oceanimonas baumannii TaxID=129578 RepID=A0A235CES7_9GAMM|nr:NAD(P)H-hydrate dehydratase [Oceanimonas baumannii]OYD22936.1 bifunctional ADP-dependent NAD(P)H-hydrate dehydratase/NAD(P)H-hydrate epimerase [Oceanimonas baumannii]TDW54034.1 NAD(P)H-hydrate epimerase [Oceanimonas baumannii]